VPVSVATDPLEETALAVGEEDEAGEVTLTPPLVCDVDIVRLAFAMFRCSFDLEKKHRPLRRCTGGKG
jgi:hypothetical protein